MKFLPWRFIWISFKHLRYDWFHGLRTNSIVCFVTFQTRPYKQRETLVLALDRCSCRELSCLSFSSSFLLVACLADKLYYCMHETSLGYIGAHDLLAVVVYITSAWIYFRRTFPAHFPRAVFMPLASAVIDTWKSPWECQSKRDGGQETRGRRHPLRFAI